MYDLNIQWTVTGWMYEGWYEGRIIVIGRCKAREAATGAAADV